jgi:hypothetical protein
MNPHKSSAAAAGEEMERCEGDAERQARWQRIGSRALENVLDTLASMPVDDEDGVPQ